MATPFQKGDFVLYEYEPGEYCNAIIADIEGDDFFVNIDLNPRKNESTEIETIQCKINQLKAMNVSFEFV